jgi:arginine-tRNA-protein transferase
MSSNSQNNRVISSVRLFRTSPHPCSYKEQELASTVFVDPDLVIDRSLNSKLSELGYRRSGAHLYRPDCDLCQACISCRVPVDVFKPKRRQRRIIKANEDLEVRESTELSGEEFYALYTRYINHRHRDGDMYPPSPEQFEAFIKTRTVDTVYFQFWLGDRLLAVAVTDVLEQGLSAVYSFFDPDYDRRSLGSYAILWQISEAQRRELPYVFLGYWVKGCRKMQYKSDYRPLQLLIDGRWVQMT